MSDKSDSYDPKETQRRAEAALRAAFNAPHKPQAELKVGKVKESRVKKTARRKAKSKKSVG